MQVKKLIPLALIIISIKLIFKKTYEDIGGYGVVTRTRYKLLGRTYAIKDYNSLSGDCVVHIFDYDNDKAYQFVNGKYNMKMGLYDVY